ncbi:MAG: tetratricopeptide repeat family protein [Ramlibacter sp.]|nr:tetratricopeptide repeat family protein [Ramlibacter sp.]
MGLFRKLVDRVGGAASAPAAVPSVPATPAVSSVSAPEWRGRGNAALAEGRLDDAQADYRRAIAASPGDALSRVSLGYVLVELARFDEALATLAPAIAAAQAGDDYLHDACYLQGRAQAGRGAMEAALASFQAALAARADFPEAALGAAQALQALSRAGAALQVLDAVLALHPAHADALEGRGTMLLALKRPAEACAAFEGALAAKGPNPDTLSNLGAALEDLGRHEDALQALAQALALDPGHAGAFYNQGHVLCRMLRVEESLAVSLEGRRLHPDDGNIAWNCAVAHLLLGQWAPGWRAFEARWRAGALEGRSPPRLAPAWTGAESLEGRAILLFAEQGYGDTLQFLRYVPAVARQAGQVFLQIPPALARLAGALPANCVLVPPGQASLQVDLQCALMSLPAAFGSTQDSIPGSVPYLHADAAQVEAWRGRLHQLGGRLCVGIAWAGNPQHRDDGNRSIALQTLRQLQRPGVSFVTLQPNLPSDVLQAWGSAAPLHRFGDEMRDFADTAALATALDLVISVDTSVAHLAGALGRPTWILLPFCPDWRWMLERTDSPWYPTARLFRQGADRGWAPVVSAVRAALDLELAR